MLRSARLLFATSSSTSAHLREEVLNVVSSYANVVAMFRDSSGVVTEQHGEVSPTLNAARGFAELIAVSA